MHNRDKCSVRNEELANKSDLNTIVLKLYILKKDEQIKD